MIERLFDTLTGMAHNGPVFEWHTKPLHPSTPLPVYHQLSVNRRPVGHVHATTHNGQVVYVGVVRGLLLTDRYPTRAAACEAVEETYRDLRWG